MPLPLSSSSSSFLTSFSLPVPKLHLSLSPSQLRLHKSPPSVVRSQLAAVAAPPLPVLSFSGEKIGEASLQLRSAPPDTARAVVHRGLVTDRQNARRGTASTLTRAEVRGGGKKPFAQKNTGRARRGSQRTPLRPGGGVIFGPKPRDWSIKINRKEKRLALTTALASAVVASDAIVIEDFSEAEEFRVGPKTKEFVAAMQRWGLDPKRKTMFLMTEVPDNVQLSCRNIGTVKVLTPRTLNIFDILNAEKLIFTKSALEYLNSMYGENADTDDDYEGEGDNVVSEDGVEEEGDESS